MRNLFISAFAVFLLFAQMSVGFSQNTQTKAPLTVAMLSQYKSVAAGQEFLAGIELVPEKGYHTYWQNPGDAGAAVRVEWVTPEGVDVTPQELPVPERIEQGNSVSFGYENKVVFLFKIKVAQNFSEPELTLKASVNAVACREVCLPVFADVALSLPIVSSGVKSADFDLLAKLQSVLPVVADWDFTAGHNQQWRLMLIARKVPAEFKDQQMFFFPRNRQQLINNAPQKTVHSADGFKMYFEPFSRSRRLGGNFEGLLVIKDKGFLVSVPIDRGVVS